ncbi:DUF2779 domain-containing protein [Maribacter algarum]|uniref:DUF2779 domain-containing protein n=1 Tax=Maribacter algarum (ex Zhang et al. 2020) TaxID=2578118 RepID=A0A5S3PTW9_9FLAO|nr:DUF2779 domain-containing protein [Maribacter algarum]TMM58446.1 DUF2779 domain-containing protein [Maribacter algarum]
MQLSKTDFIQYLNCPESLWLLKNKPKEFNKYKGEFSLFLEKLIKEGYEVEEYAKLLFPEGINLPENSTPQHTQQHLDSESNVLFQPSFLTKKGAFARIDVLEKLIDNTYHIYEIKSASSIKKGKLEDTCFQKYVLQECGYTVSKTSIIHLNKEYVKQGEIIPDDLLEIADVTEQIDSIYSTVVNDINAALHFINKEVIVENQCSSRYKTRSNHCDTFKYFNKDVPDFNIYEIARISAKKIGLLVDNNQLDILDIPLDFDLSVIQQTQVESVKKELVVINKLLIDKTLSNLKFPLHFVDYETFPTAVPKVDKMGPHNHLVFQVSIHSLKENGVLTHFEWLGEKLEQPIEMLKQMQDFTGLKGTFISWNAPFEISRNKDMLAWIPEFSEYLNFMNAHMFDLMNVFKTDYVDYRFHGSTSIKKVLPVLCPQFSYSDLKVSDGTMALDTWGRMVCDPNFDEDVEQTRKDLLEYCKLDTLAMVKIYKVLKNI